MFACFEPGMRLSSLLERERPVDDAIDFPHLDHRPNMMLDLYREGQLDLDGLVTKTYPLDGINEGYDDMRAGRNIRGVLVYD